MKKSFVAFILLYSNLGPIAFAHSLDTLEPNRPLPRIAILDTAIDASNPALNGRIVYEACVTEWNSCPNGLSEMEGTNSASIPRNFLERNGFDHGFQMASVAIATNPNIEIIFVRIIGMHSNGLRQYSGEATVYQALDWVIRNQQRLRIQAVSLSQGHHKLESYSSYCPKTPITESKIVQLKNMGIPVFTSSGNNGDYSRLDWPACIPSTIAIASANSDKTISSYSNYDSALTDFIAIGKLSISGIYGKPITISGSSISTVISASIWASLSSRFPELTYDELYSFLKNRSSSISNSFIADGKYIDMKLFSQYIFQNTTWRSR